MHKRPATPPRVHRSKRDPRGRTTAAEQSSSSQAGGTTNPEACASLRTSRMPRSHRAPDTGSHEVAPAGERPNPCLAQKGNRAAQRDIRFTRWARSRIIRFPIGQAKKTQPETDRDLGDPLSRIKFKTTVQNRLTQRTADSRRSAENHRAQLDEPTSYAGLRTNPHF